MRRSRLDPEEVIDEELEHVRHSPVVIEEVYEAIGASLFVNQPRSLNQFAYVEEEAV